MNKAFPLETSFFESLDVWAIRIAHVEGLDLDKTLSGFQAYFSKIIISEETSNKGVIHHHGLLANEGTNKDQITKYIRAIYPDAKGNKCMYIRPADNKKQLLKYTVKEGKYRQVGFTNTFIDAALSCSSSKEQMQKEFTNLLEEFQLDQIDFNTYIKKYILLKAKHDQPLYTNHLIAFFRGIMLKRKKQIDDTVVQAYADHIEFKILGDN